MSSISTFVRHTAVLAAASGLVLTSGMAANAAAAPAQRDSAPASNVDVTGLVSAPVNADSSVKISFDRPAVATVAAPVIEQPVAAAPAPAAAPAAAPKATVQVQAAPAASVLSSPTKPRVTIGGRSTASGRPLRPSMGQDATSASAKFSCLP